MLYFKAKKEYDQTPRYKKTARGRVYDNTILIQNELYTAREREKLAMSADCFDVVSIPKTRVYFSFGARFEMR